MNNNFNPIGDSELIITDKGTIYHLDIAPENLAPLVITVGDPGRVGEVSKYFDRITHKAQHREFVTHTGYIGDRHISCVSTGIGPDNIDIVFNELDALANIDFSTRTIKDIKTKLSIVRMGTCGALQPDVPVDSMVVSSHAIGLDNLMHYYRFENNPTEIFILNDFVNHCALSSKNLTPYIAESAISLRKDFGRDYVHGITVTCPGFYGPQGRVLRLPLAFPHLIDALTTFRNQDTRIINFEMETSAMYGLAKIMGHKCLSISTVVANRVNKTFSTNAAAAVDNMIRKSLEILVGG
ncbi:MAG: nucleoside phosphorylase [Taibaiella sp.]|nr:nucleoside phosphorylase [Taibaiella sp.]